MYPQDQDKQETMQQTLNNTPMIRFPPNTSPTHGVVQWSLDFEPIFMSIPPTGGSVPTTPDDEKTHSFEISIPNASTFNPNASNTQQGIVHLSDDFDTDYGITNE